MVKSDASAATPSTASASTSILDDASMLTCFLNHPAPNEIPFPLDYQLLQQQQFDDLTLQHARATQPNAFPVHDFGPVQLICHIANANEAWKIALATQALLNIVKWYHIVLNHVGITRLWLTISMYFYHPNLHPFIERVVHDCTICQCYKLSGPGYGHLPPRNA